MADVNLVLSMKRLAPNAVLPSYGSAAAAGMDLHAWIPEGEGAERTRTLAPGQRMLIKSGIAPAIPTGWYGRVAPRSGLALKHGLDMLAGVIVSDYRGEIGIILLNTGDQPLVINTGDRVDRQRVGEGKKEEVR